MHVDYKNPWVQQLRDLQQDAPREQLLARIDAAERLIASVDVDQHYQSQQVLEHLDHDDAVVESAERKVRGRDLVHDLRLLVEDLSDAQWRAPYLAIINPTLWEVGHVAWFMEHWCLRWRGADRERAPSRLADADRFYDSAKVPHTDRWKLPPMIKLPSA